METLCLECCNYPLSSIYKWKLKTNTVAGGDHLNITNTDIDFFFNL